jgi:hypothetical protein
MLVLQGNGRAGIVGVTEIAGFVDRACASRLGS